MHAQPGTAFITTSCSTSSTENTQTPQRTTVNVPADVATGTKADAVDAKRAKIARIRAIILITIVYCC